jgi:hypothetical protein
MEVSTDDRVRPRTVRLLDSVYEAATQAANALVARPSTSVWIQQAILERLERDRKAQARRSA